MEIIINLTEEEFKAAEEYSKSRGVLLSEAMKQVFFEKVEDEYDIAIADEALRKYDVDHKSYSHEELKKILGL